MDVPRIQIKEEKEKDDGFISLKDIEICNRLVVKHERNENDRKATKKQEAKEKRKIAAKKYREKQEAKEKNRIAVKKYREKQEVKNKRRIAAQLNYQKHKEDIMEKCKKYRENQEAKEKRRIAAQLNYQKHKEDILKKKKILYQKNKKKGDPKDKEKKKEHMQEQHQLQQINVPVAAVPGIIQQQAAPVAGAAPANPARERQVIWQGVLEWQEKTRDPQILRHVPCQVSATVTNGESEVKAEQWPQKLLMQLIPQTLISHFGGDLFRNACSVMFHPQQECERLEDLAKLKSTRYAGCVYLTEMVNPNVSESKVLMLLYSPEKKAYIGFIPKYQTEFVEMLLKVIEEKKIKQVQQHSGAED